MLNVLQTTGGIASTNCYLVFDDSSNDAILFDAPDHTIAPLLDQIDQRKLNLLGLYLTHGHFDHVADHQLLSERFPSASILIHELDHPKLQEPNSGTFILPFTIPPGKATAFVTDNQTLNLGAHPITVLHTPGHSPGHVMYHFPEDSLLVGGDLIICGAVGRTDLPDSDEVELFKSIRRVMQLPGNTTLLPGHCDPSSLQDERQNNPYVHMAMDNG
jgi:glyoxylase-like metal-dependent hydrolase (beta-lactamase superfamily II)